LSFILRELMRWYDVEVVYEGKVPERYFTADMSREKSLASILKIFEVSNIRTRIEGKKLFIKP
jgi:transmembrane sensor